MTILSKINQLCELLGVERNKYVYCYAEKKICFLNDLGEIYASNETFTNFDLAQDTFLNSETNFIFLISRDTLIGKIKKRNKGRRIRKRKQILLKNQNKTCNICKTNLNRKTATIDHIIPISKGGTSKTENLQILCYDCNQEKSDKIL